MFKKVIIAEDHESGNIAVQKTLDILGVKNFAETAYCDDTLQKIQIGIAEQSAFDLLITDLSFDEDHREQKIKTGRALIEAVRNISPNIKIIVFSVTKKPKIIEALFQEQNINGYVSKGRGDAHELKKAIETVYKGERYLSQEHKLSIRESRSIELKNVEISILKLLSQGVFQKNIPSELQKMQITPNSLSSVEKTINHLKISFNANNNEQLIAICKDLGII